MPEWGPEIRARLSPVRLSPAREAEIVEELSQHLEDRWREIVAAGVDPDEARHQALGESRGKDVLGRYLAPLRQSRWHDPSPPTLRRTRTAQGGIDVLVLRRLLLDQGIVGPSSCGG